MRDKIKKIENLRDHYNRKLTEVSDMRRQYSYGELSPSEEKEYDTAIQTYLNKYNTYVECLEILKGDVK